jgi:hypothetical protein
MLPEQELQQRARTLLNHFDQDTLRQLISPWNDDIAALTYSSCLVAPGLPESDRANLIRVCLELAFMLGWQAAENRIKAVHELPNFALPPQPD